MKRWYLVGLACMALATGCDQGNPMPTSPDGTEAETGLKSAAVTSSAVGAEQVHATAKLIALAMRNREARTAVRDAMRSSPLTEHKLSFKEFLATSAGKVVVREAALGSGLTAASVRERMGRLPPLDFYVPVHAHRLAWRGTADYVVGASVAGRTPSRVFDPSGKELAANLDNRARGTAALFMLQSAEPKGRRIMAQAARSGLTIQDPGDGGQSATLTTVDALGRGVTIDLSVKVPTPGSPAICPTPPYYCAPPPPPPPPTTRLTRLSIDGVCDNGFCFEGNEFEFKTTRPNGTSSTLRIEGVPSTGVLTLSSVLTFTTPVLSGTLRVAVKETDGTSGDDIWAYVTYQPNFPNYVGDILVTAQDNNVAWQMKQRPHVGVFDPYRLALRIAW